MVSLSLTISVSRRPSTEQPTSSPPLPQNTQVYSSTASPIHYTASIGSRSRSHSRSHSCCPSYANSIHPSQPYSNFDFSHPGPAPVYSAKRPESGNGSLERLLSSSGRKKRVSIVQLEHGRLKTRIVSMENGNGVQIERKKSYGIGGAGNIRRPSEVIYPVRTNADGSRRRSSVWSSISAAPGTSPDGKRHSILGFFRRGSTAQDVVVSGALDDVDPTDRE